jgi:hypothetical protein
VLAISAAVVVVAAAATTTWFVHWRSSLHVLLGYPAYGSAQPLAVGQSLYFGNNLIAARAISHSDDAGLSLHVSAVRPLVATNTSAADITVLRCPLAFGGAGPDGIDRRRADAVCTSLTPFDGGSVHIGSREGDDDIVLAVTPHRPGTVRIAGLEVSYSTGLRHGTQHVGVQARVTTG